MNTITNRNLETVEDIIAIVTSDIVEILSPEFKLVGGSRFHKSSNKHYVDLKSEDSTIRLYNSFDRSLALNFSLVTGEIAIDLGVDRLIHIGNKAKEFTLSLEEAKDEIMKAIPTARKIVANLSRVKVTKDMAKVISDIVFSVEMESEQYVAYNSYVDILLENKELTVKDYISSSLSNYFKGNYTITQKTRKLVGRVHDDLFRKAKMQNLIIKTLLEEYPEYFL